MTSEYGCSSSSPISSCGTSSSIISTTSSLPFILFLQIQEKIQESFHKITGGNFFISTNKIACTLAGLVVAADISHHTLIWLSQRYQEKQRQHCYRYWQKSSNNNNNNNNNNKDENETSLKHYWKQLSEAILNAPRLDSSFISSNKKEEKRIILPPIPNPILNFNFSENFYTYYNEIPEAVQLLWDDHVRYTLNESEVLKILKSLINKIIDNEETAIAAASLALLWRLQLIRSIHEALIIYKDVSRCSDNFDDIEEYSKPFFKHFFYPIKKYHPVIAVFSQSWESLSLLLKELKYHRRLLQRRNIWSLMKYIYTGGKERIISCAAMGILTAISAQSASTGLVLQERVERILRTGIPLFFFFLNNNNNNNHINNKSKFSTIIELLTFEWVRRISTSAITQITKDYIRTAASHQRDCIKKQLYEALARTPLTFFDTHNQEDIEALIYYANDLEGVDVHVHDYFSRIVTAFTSLITVASVLLDKRSGTVVVLTVTISNLIDKGLSILRKWCESYDNNNNNSESNDAEEEENNNATIDGVMLRGMDIILYIRELRPYAADIKLMSWWISHTNCYRKRNIGIQRLMHLIFRFRHIWAIDAFSSLLKWLLPVMITSQAVINSQAQVILIGAIYTVQEVINQASDAPRVLEIILNNAYKANILERILDSRYWEEEEEEEEEEVTEQLENNNNDNYMEVHAIRANNLQFYYPTSPTVGAFISPASFIINLQNEITGEGRLICVTGPSGCGKTTLLRLLLALYTENNNSLMLKLGHRNNNNNNNNNNENWVPVTSISRHFLRRILFSYLPQTPILFPGASIAQNISLQSRVSIISTLLLERIHACAEAAACLEFIQRFPLGILTPVCENISWASPGSIRLSCGQAQRLMLARALFHGGRILLMDEPTAALDVDSKRILINKWRELLKVKKLRGIICVTHDEEVLKEADEIIRM